MIYSSLGLKPELKKLGEKAKELTRMNIAFTSYFLISDIDNCYQILIDSKRIPEAAFFAKTYCPSKISKTVELWKKELERTHPLTAQKIADPMDYINEDSFSDLGLLLQLEKIQ